MEGKSLFTAIVALRLLGWGDEEMTVYGLMTHLTAACGPSASFGDVHLWWDESQQKLFLSKRKPSAKAECIDDSSQNASR